MGVGALRHPVIWITLLVLIVLAFIHPQLLKLRTYKGLQFSQPASTPVSTAPAQATPTAWTYDRAWHGDNHGLTQQQCNAAFPDFYYEIHRAADRWKDGRLKEETLMAAEADAGTLRVLVQKHELRILATRNNAHPFWGFRIKAVAQMLQRAISAVEEEFPAMEILLSVDDQVKLPRNPNHQKNFTAFTFCRNLEDSRMDDVWIMPDFHFWSAGADSGDFVKLEKAARKHDSAIADKEPVAFWRGVIDTNKELRGALLDVTKDQPWADVKAIDWGTKENVVPEEDFCNYRFLINTEGVRWSSRLTAILLCDTIPVIHDRQYTAHYYHLLEQYINFIPTNRDFSDLHEQIQPYLNDGHAAQELANRARDTFRERYITPAATACYWREMLRRYHDVAFTPRLFEDGQERGITLETFLREYHDTDYRPELNRPSRRPEQ